MALSHEGECFAALQGATHPHDAILCPTVIPSCNLRTCWIRGFQSHPNIVQRYWHISAVHIGRSTE